MIDSEMIRVRAASDCHSHRDSHGSACLSESGTVTVAGRGREAAFADSVFSTLAISRIQPVYERVGTSLTLLKPNNR
jgi:hypothetical protein